jgi:hypothetical protein
VDERGAKAPIHGLNSVGRRPQELEERQLFELGSLDLPRFLAHAACFDATIEYYVVQDGGLA